MKMGLQLDNMTTSFTVIWKYLYLRKFAFYITVYYVVYAVYKCLLSNLFQFNADVWLTMTERERLEYLKHKLSNSELHLSAV